MDTAQIYTRLTGIFQDVFDEDSIKVTPELSAKEVDGWDSLTHIRLILTSKGHSRSNSPLLRSANWKMLATLWR